MLSINHLTRETTINKPLNKNNTILLGSGTETGSEPIRCNSANWTPSLLGSLTESIVTKKFRKAGVAAGVFSGLEKLNNVFLEPSGKSNVVLVINAKSFKDFPKIPSALVP